MSLAEMQSDTVLTSLARPESSLERSACSGGDPDHSRTGSPVMPRSSAWRIVSVEHEEEVLRNLGV